MDNTFHSAKHCAWILWIAQWINAFDLTWHNRLCLEPSNLEILKSIPKNAGLILVTNHADEMDIKIFMELSRRSRRRFTFMMNAESFEEWHGFAGWCLQCLGCFSIERAGSDQTAKQYAVDVVKGAREALVICPEGEIFYLNDLIQPFKRGVAYIGMQAITEMRETQPDRRVFILPVAIKYRYRKTIESILNQKIRRMEQYLFRRTSYLSFQERLAYIMAELLNRREQLSHVQIASLQLSRLKEQVCEVRTVMLSKVAEKYRQMPFDPKTELIDRAQKMIFFLREQLRRKKLFSSETRLQLRKDIDELKLSIRMAGWQPHYTSLNPSEERLAETVMKLEREVFEEKRPRPLGNRNVFMRIGTPIELSDYIQPFKEDPSAVSHQITEQLRTNIQSLIEEILLPRE